MAKRSLPKATEKIDIPRGPGEIHKELGRILASGDPMAHPVCGVIGDAVSILDSQNKDLQTAFVKGLHGFLHNGYSSAIAGAVSPTKQKAQPHLFFLRIPTDQPAMNPNPKFHLGLAVEHLAEQLTNLDAVEQLTAIDQQNNTVLAMSYGITAVLEKLQKVHEHFKEIIGLIESGPGEKGGVR